ncbi:MAG: murein hydrolase activator EnvC [Bacteroidia bacterium]
MGLSLVLLLFAQSVFAQEIDTQSAKASLKLSDQFLTGEYSQTEKALADLRIINLRMRIQEKLISDLRLNILNAEDEIELLQENHCRIGETIENIKQEYSQQIRRTYILYSEQGFWLSLLAAENITEAYYRVIYFREYSRYRKEQIKILTESRQLLAGKSKQINRLQRRRKRLARSQQRERAQLRDTERLRKDLNKSLRTEAQSLKKAYHDQQAALLSLLKETENPVRIQVGETELSEAAVDSLFTVNKGKMEWPVPPAQSLLIESFGEIQDEFGNLRDNNGWAFRVAEGQNVHSVFAGRVTGVRIVPLLGTAVIISHGRYRTAYANLSATALREGQFLQAGSVIGIVRTDRRSGESIVRFMMYEEPSAFLDPSNWLK